jgi:predicted esterase
MRDDGAIVIGPEPAEAAAVAILAHGRGGSAADMANLARAFANPAIRYVLPSAPGGTWYPQGFMAPLERNEPALSGSLATYARLIDEVIADGVQPENIILGGFSQGACLTAEVLIRNPRRYGAVLILTGGLIGPPGTGWPVQPALRGVPVYLTGSKVDQWVPVARVEETERVFTASGADVRLRIFDEGPHGVSAEEIASARAILSSWPGHASANDGTERRMGKTN